MRSAASPRPARPARVLAAMSLGVLIAQVDTSVVNLAAKRIGADLGSSLSGMQWMLDAYNVVYAAFLLTAGALGDLYGRRGVFVTGIVLFALGSVACAVAPSTPILLAGRALSGLGAALELPMSLVLLSLAFSDPAERRHAFGIWASCNGLAFILGPTLGGLLVDTLGWRSIFYLILPLCVAAIALARTDVEESSSPEGRHLDVPGQVSAIAALAGLSFFVIEGSHRGWSDAMVVIAGIAAAAGAVTFTITERGRTDGLVPFELFRRPTFSASVSSAGLVNFGAYPLVFLVALYFQAVRGDSPFVAALHLLPLPACFFVVSSRWNARIVHAIGARRAIAGGMAAIGAGTLLCAFGPVLPGKWIVEAGLAVAGVGLGIFTAPVNEMGVASVPRARSGTASGVLNTSRMVGATLGIAILGSVFAHFAGQPGDGNFLGGFRLALSLGASAQLAGAALVLHFVAPDHANAAHREARRGAD